MDIVGFVGLGRMGRPMASNLCRKGFQLLVHDVDQKAVSELELLQARPGGSAGAVAKGSDVIVTMLPNSAVVDQVVAGPDGVFANARPGSLIMDMSTVEPGDHGQAGRPGQGARARLRRCARRPPRQPRRSRRIPFHGRRSGEGFRAREAHAGSDGHHHLSLRRRRHRHPHQAREQLSRRLALPAERRGARAVAALRPRRWSARWTCSTAPRRRTASSR